MKYKIKKNTQHSRVGRRGGGGEKKKKNRQRVLCDYLPDFFFVSLYILQLIFYVNDLSLSFALYMMLLLFCCRYWSEMMRTGNMCYVFSFSREKRHTHDVSAKARFMCQIRECYGVWMGDLVTELHETKSRSRTVNTMIESFARFLWNIYIYYRVVYSTYRRKCHSLTLSSVSELSRAVATTLNAGSVIYDIAYCLIFFLFSMFLCYTQCEAYKQWRY